MGTGWRTLRADVLPNTRVVTKPGFVRFIASDIFLNQKAVWVIKYLEERELRKRYKVDVDSLSRWHQEIS